MHNLRLPAWCAQIQREQSFSFNMKCGIFITLVGVLMCSCLTMCAERGCRSRMGEPTPYYLETVSLMIFSLFVRTMVHFSLIFHFNYRPLRNHHSYAPPPTTFPSNLLFKPSILCYIFYMYVCWSAYFWKKEEQIRTNYCSTNYFALNSIAKEKKEEDAISIIQKYKWMSVHNCALLLLSTFVLDKSTNKIKYKEM